MCKNTHFFSNPNNHPKENLILVYFLTFLKGQNNQSDSNNHIYHITLPRANLKKG